MADLLASLIGLAGLGCCLGSARSVTRGQFRNAGVFLLCAVVCAVVGIGVIS